MENSKKKFNVQSVVIYVLGIVVYGVGASLITRANLGVSPISSVPFIFTFFTPLSLGTSQFIFNVTLFLIQLMWMGKDFKKLWFLQIPASIVFSLSINLFLWLSRGIDTQALSLLERWALFALSVGFMSLGVAILKITDLVMLPGDGIANVLSIKTNMDFGRAKVITDCACATITIIISFTILGRLEAVKIGTVVAAIVTGNLANFFMRVITPTLDKAMGRA